jgi:uncharacterized protein YdaU (DUF1376 family)
MHYYQFNIGDYHSHTNHLSESEDLAYRRMIDWSYLHEKPLSLDIDEISRHIRMRTQCECIGNVLKEFFTKTENGYISKRIFEEINKVNVKSAKASVSAKSRWDKENHAIAMRTQCELDANAMLPITHNPLPNTHNPLNTITSKEVIYQTGFDEKIEKKKKGKVQHPDCPHQAVIDLFHKTLPTLPKIEIWHSNRQTSLRSRWREVCVDHAKDGLEVSEKSILKWFEDYFIYVGKSKFLIGQIQQKNRQPFCATLEWLLKPASFTKVVEGQYHKE